MKRLLILLPAIVMTMMLALMSGCFLTGGDDDDDSGLSMMLLDQMSGNCAMIEKSDDQYMASGTSRPKGSCADTTFYTTDSSVAKTMSDQYFNDIIAVLNAKKGSKLDECDSVVTEVENMKDIITESTIVQQAESSLYLSMYGENCMFFPGGVFCLSETDIINSQSMNSDLRYHPVGDVKADMATSLNYYKDLAKTDTLQNATGFTDEQIDNGTIASADDIDLLASAKHSAFMFSNFLLTPAPACTTAILEANSDLKNLLIRMGGNNLSNFGVTSEDTAAATDVIVALYFIFPASLTCGYGTGFTPTESTGVCPDTYPTW